MTVQSLLKRLIPSFIRRRLDRFLRRLWALPRGLSILVTPLPSTEKIHVFYGHGHIPHLGDKTHGGIVKFQHMQDLFPNSPRQFNILYMVSSRMPYGAVQIAWFARRKGVRLVWNQNGVAYPAWHGAGWEESNTLLARLLSAADHVFYQSEFCKLSGDRYLGERKGSWEILYNPVDTQVFSPAESDPDPKHLVLLLGGTQYRYYRIACAIQVLALLVRKNVDTRLLVTGRLCWIPDEADAWRIVCGLAAKLGVEDRVEFVGPYAQSDAPSIYRRAHLLLHTKYNDPCPTVVVEAMACGLPVVYSHSGGVPELVDKGAGIGVPADLSWEHDIPPDPEAMAEAVIEVSERRKEFAHAARRRAVKMFDLSPWLQRHHELFEELLS